MKIYFSEHDLAILAAILTMQISQIYILSGRTQAEIHRNFEINTIRTVDSRQENMLFGAYIGHFGSHFEYANEPNLHIFMENTSRDIYENLRSIS